MRLFRVGKSRGAGVPVCHFILTFAHQRAHAHGNRDAAQASEPNPQPLNFVPSGVPIGADRHPVVTSASYFNALVKIRLGSRFNDDSQRNRVSGSLIPDSWRSSGGDGGHERRTAKRRVLGVVRRGQQFGARGVRDEERKSKDVKQVRADGWHEHGRLVLAKARNRGGWGTGGAAGAMGIWPRRQGATAIPLWA